MANPANNRNMDTEQSEQEALNRSFDWDYNKLIVEPSDFDGANLHRQISRLVAKKITVSGSNTYIAIAPINSAEDDAVWQVKRIAVSGSDTITTWADGNADFDNIATDLTTLSYMREQFTLKTITTDASVTPTTVHLTLGGAENAVRVYTDETPQSEKYYYLYVRINGAAASKIRMYRYQARIIRATTSDTISFGTSDGRSLKISSFVEPATLPDTVGVSGTVSTDIGGAPFWVPVNAHVSLPSRSSGFQIDSDGTERDIFLSENINGVWSPMWWVKQPASGGLKILSNSTQVAISTYDGAVLSINAPTGSGIGGAQNRTRLLIPKTGTTRTCSDATTLMTAINAAVQGDEIVLGAGTYTLAADITNADFTANIAYGNTGSEGIIIRGATGVRDDVVIEGKSININNGGSTTSAAKRSIWADLSVNLTGLTLGIFTVSNGLFDFDNVRVYGPQTTGGHLLCITATTNANITQVRTVDCMVDNAYQDCISTDGSGTTHDTHASTWAKICRSTMTISGGTSSDQCLTAHGGYPTYAYGCTISDANQNIVAHDNYSYGQLFYCTLSGGTRSGIIQRTDAYACTINNKWELALDTGSPCPNYYAFNKVLTAGGASGLSIFNVGFPMLHNRFIWDGTGATKRDISITNANAVREILGNVWDGLRQAVDISGSTGTSQLQFINNFFRNSSLNAFVDTATAYPLYLRNNVIGDNNTGQMSLSAGLTIDTDYNFIQKATVTNFTPGAQDTLTTSAPGLDSTGMPTAGGNIDNDGTAAAVDYVGASDPYGLVLFYGGRASRGPREIPAIYTGAVLFPDIWI